MSEHSSRLARIIVPIGILVFGVLTAGYLIGTRPQARPNPPQEKVWPVRVVAAARQNLRPNLVVYGEVIAGREAEIRAMVPGRVVELNDAFVDGATVERGSAIAAIDPFEFETTVAERRADLDEARNRLTELTQELRAEDALLAVNDEQIELRRRDLERSANLRSTRQVSEKAYDDADLALKSALETRLQRNQTIARLRSRIQQQGAVIARAEANLSRAQRNLADSRIHAPFSGYVADVSVALGKRVAVGESIGRLIDRQRLEVRFEIPNRDYARLLAEPNGALAGRKLRVIWRLGGETFEFPAVIGRLGAEIDSSTGGIEMFATLAGSSEDSGLRPGAFVEVAIPDIEYRQVLELPESAVADDGTVYIVVDDRVQPLTMEVVREFGDTVLVRGEMPADAAVVAEQFPGIGPGLKVRPL